MKSANYREVTDTVTEIKNNFFARQSWNEDAQLYALYHCGVYNDDDRNEYVIKVNALLKDT